MPRSLRKAPESFAAALARRSAPVVASLLVSACGLIVGIKPLEVVTDDDAGVVSSRDADTSADADGPSLDAPTEVGAEPARRPPAGTYAYSVVGSDKISGAFTFVAPYGPTATVTVEHLEAGCFKQTVALRDNYQDSMHFCIKGVDSVQDTGSRSQQFALNIGAQTTTTCMPGDVYFSSAPSPGQSWNHDCTGQNKDDKSGGSTFSTIGSYRFVGNELRSVAGVDVPVMHFHDERNVAGAQTGTNIADWYLAVEDGILVRLSRTIELDYNSVIGNIHYHESALLTLTTPPSVLRDGGTD